MKQYLTSLTVDTLDKLRRQLEKHAQPIRYSSDIMAMDQEYLENSMKSVVIITDILVRDGLIIGNIRTETKTINMTAKLYGMYFTEMKTDEANISEDISAFLNFFKKKDHMMKQPPQIFLEQQSVIEWSEETESYSGRFEFIVDPTMPNSKVFLIGQLRKTITYIIEVKGEGLHYLRPIEIRYSSDYKSVDKEVSYVTNDFQRLRACCMNSGIYRLEAILPTNIYEQGETIMGRVNYFCKSKVQLAELCKCRVDLVARIKWLNKNAKQYSYIPICSKTVVLESQPQMGMIVGRYKLPIPSNLPCSTNNILFTVTYFTMITPIDQTGGYTIKILQEHIQEFYIVEQHSNY